MNLTINAKRMRFAVVVCAKNLGARTRKKITAQRKREVLYVDLKMVFACQCGAELTVIAHLNMGATPTKYFSQVYKKWPSY